ncbi:putative Rna binding protein [Leptomonas seymouri]|uniref:Putative Rna binding protein n=1 Tax=Leptomonas seymouri TaxID=5684 RepID=A0A0N1HZQ3_LEPSE|nr:putative Rna binding protein [Leptomonas seymouri]|eukprot:KPI88752.1 putative Rna binding protein [Leptomonas seymouri]
MTTYKREDLRRVSFSNLDEHCNEDIIYELCLQFGPIRNISWPTEVNLTGVPQRASRCYVDYDNVEDAKYCYEALYRARVKLFNKELRVYHASIDIEAPGGALRSGPGAHAVVGLHEVGAKVVVRNVDYRATEFDITRFFESFGAFAAPPRMLRDSVGNFRGTVVLSYKTFEASDRVIRDMDQKTFRDRLIAVHYAQMEDGSGRLHGTKEERANAVLIREEERRYREMVAKEMAHVRQEKQQSRVQDASWAEKVNVYNRPRR